MPTLVPLWSHSGPTSSPPRPPTPSPPLLDMALYKEDKAAAFVGLIGGAILILIMVLVVINLTNRKFAGHSAAAGAPAGQTTH